MGFKFENLKVTGGGGHVVEEGSKERTWGEETDVRWRRDEDDV
jgi:hypothetical protein